MEVAGSPLFAAAAAASDADEEVRRGAILLMGLSSSWYLKIPLWPDDAAKRWSASLPASAEGGDDERPSTSAVAWRRDDFPDWGRHKKRSRTLAPAGIREAEPRSRAEKKVMRRASPQSPLEGYSSASASGGEEGTRWSPPANKVARSSSHAGVPVSVPPAITHAPCAAAAAATVVAFPGDGFQFPTKMVESHAATSPISGPIVRPAGMKLKKVELKAQEKWLLEERSKIQQELQELGRAVEVAKAERRELELRLKLPQAVTKAAEAPEDVQLAGMSQDIAPGASQMLTVPPSECKQKGQIEIPDLNEPLPLFSD